MINRRAKHLTVTNLRFYIDLTKALLQKNRRLKNKHTFQWVLHTASVSVHVIDFYKYKTCWEKGLKHSS